MARSIYSAVIVVLAVAWQPRDGHGTFNRGSRSDSATVQVVFMPLADNQSGLTAAYQDIRKKIVEGLTDSERFGNRVKSRQVLLQDRAIIEDIKEHQLHETDLDPAVIKKIRQKLPHKVTDVLFVTVHGHGPEDLQVDLALVDLASNTRKSYKRTTTCRPKPSDQVASIAGNLARQIGRQTPDRHRPHAAVQVSPKDVVTPGQTIVLSGCESEDPDGDYLKEWEWRQDECDEPGRKRDAPILPTAWSRIASLRAHSESDSNVPCVLPPPHKHTDTLSITLKKPGIYRFTLRVRQAIKRGREQDVSLSTELEVIVADTQARQEANLVRVPNDDTTYLALHAQLRDQTALASRRSLPDRQFQWIQTDGPASAPIFCVDQSHRRLERTIWLSSPECYVLIRSGEPGHYAFQLVTRYSTPNQQQPQISEPLTVSYLVAPPPMANAGPARRYTSMHSPIALDAWASYDALDESPTFLWSIVDSSSRTSNTHARLSNRRSRRPVFTADKRGTYLVSLTVRARREIDGRTYWDEDQAFIEIVVEREAWLIHVGLGRIPQYSTLVIGARIPVHGRWSVRVVEALARYREADGFSRGGFSVGPSLRVLGLRPNITVHVHAGAYVLIEDRTPLLAGDAGAQFTLELHKGLALLWDVSGQFGDLDEQTDAAIDRRWRLQVGVSLALYR